MTLKDPMPFGKYRGVPIGDIPADYKAWLVKQDGFATKNPELHALFTGAPSTATPAETEIDTLEEELMLTAPEGFAEWWWAQYGKNLRKVKSPHYLPYLRISLTSWKSCLAYLTGDQAPPPLAPNEP